MQFILVFALIPDCEQNFYIDKYRIKRHGGVLYLVLEGKPAFPLRVTAAFESVLNKQMEFGDTSQAAIRLEQLCTQPVQQGT